MKKIALPAFLLVSKMMIGLFISLKLHADEHTFKIDNKLGLQWRGFSQQGYVDNKRSDFSISFESDIYFSWNEEKDAISFVPFGRLDQIDNERNHADIRELAWTHVGDGWELRTGIRKVFWGVTESRHLVDIINQTDLVENVDEEDKLGQPMINFSKVSDWGIVDVYVLPGFRERTFPGSQGRLRPYLPIEADEAIYESGAKYWRTDFALRWQHSVGNWEWGVYYFYGTSREPRFDLWIKPLDISLGELLKKVPIDIDINQFDPDLLKKIPQLQNIDWQNLPAINLDDYFALVPIYDVIDQEGLDLQYIYEGWAFKLELMSRGGQGDRFTSAVFGFEYTQVGIFDTPIDLGWIVEYLFDDRKDAAPTFLERDIFLGYRVAFNNVASSQLLMGMIWDPESTEKIFGIEFSHRLAENLSLSAEARFFESGDKVPDDALHLLKETVLADPDNKTWFLQDEDFVQIELTWYF